MSPFEASSNSEEATIVAGKSFAAALSAGDVVALCGDLGAGKTHFAKGVVEGLGASDGVTSPTFALVNEYRTGSIPIFHFDFYRLDAAEEVVRIGWDDYLDEDGVLLVEWADRFPELLPEHTRWIDLTIDSDGSHLIAERAPAS